MSHLFQTLSQYYTGFTVTENVGNNTFSFQERKNTSIFVPPIVRSKVDALTVSDKVAIGEMVDGQELSCHGLKEFVSCKWRETEVVVVDNHNHAFFVWCVANRLNIIPSACTVVHIDQHADARVPDKPAPGAHVDLSEMFEYSQREINIGNFIHPAKEMGIVKNVHLVRDASHLDETIFNDQPYILDLDIDFFAPEMDYISFDDKMTFIAFALDKASMVTIATSPLFMDQKQAIEIIKKIFRLRTSY